jgi:hypothetical protein
MPTDSRNWSNTTRELMQIGFIVGGRRESTCVPGETNARREPHCFAVAFMLCLCKIPTRRHDSQFNGQYPIGNGLDVCMWS